MSPQLVALLVLLIQEAPALAVKLMAIWTERGKVTPQQWADFIESNWPDAESFFKSVPLPGAP